MSFRRLLGLSLLPVVVLGTAVILFGQEGTATLRGRVLDPNGAILPAATVSIANQETGLNRRTATTDEAGNYVFASLTPGLYRITVDATGFKKSVKDNVKLDVGEAQEFDFTLEVGGSQEVVNVTSEEPLVDSASSKISGHIGEKELIEL